MRNQWVRNPFSFLATHRDDLSLQDEEALAELSSNVDLKQKLGEMPIMRFWLSVENEFPQICTKALKVLIPFTSTYLCECGFSALTLIKSKYRSRLKGRFALISLCSAASHQAYLCIKSEASLFPLIWAIN